MRRAPGFSIALLSADAVFQNWTGIRELMHEAFTESSYNGAFLDGDPARDTYVEINPEQPKRNVVQHVVAIEEPFGGMASDEGTDLKRVFLGALFSVYTRVPPDAILNERLCTEPGWFFTVARLHGPVHKARRRAVTEAIIGTMHPSSERGGLHPCGG